MLLAAFPDAASPDTSNGFVMPIRPGFRVFSRLCALGVLASAVACAKSPTGPTAGATPATLSTGALAGGETAALLAQCLGGNGGPSCFGTAGLQMASVTSAAITSAPVFNN